MGQIVNQELMANLAIEFNVGADILSKGNRTISDKLGAANMSGDTVSVTVTDSGKVFRDSLDISGLRGTMAVKRASVPVRVTPIGTAAEASEGELTLAIEKPEVMKKRVANLQDEVNRSAYRGILGSTQPYVCPSIASMTGDNKDRAYRETCFDAEAHTQTSKLGGSIFGMAHPQTWNRVVPTLQANFGANQKVGNDLYENKLGNFMGYEFTKGVDTMRVLAEDLAAAPELTNATITVGLDGQITLMNLTTLNGHAGDSEGEIFPMPVLLTDATAVNGVKHPVMCVDAFGKSTGIQKAVFFKWHFDTWNMIPGQGWVGVTGHWDLAQPLFLAGPRKNADSVAYNALVASGTVGPDRHGFIQPDFDWYAKQEWNKLTVTGVTITTELDFTIGNFLSVGSTYLAPMVMFHEDDFLIGIKGLEKMGSHDSLTVPTDYADKGIIPWRGTFWEDPYTSLGLFRVDGLMGFGMYMGVSGASIFLPID
jgi:hypothetical protein